MGALTGFWRRLRELTVRGVDDRETAEEMTAHVEQLVADRMARGLDEAEATRQVRLEVGSITEARERVAEGRPGYALEEVARDIRHGARVLRRNPGATLLSLVTMGVGIGASALLFSMVGGIVLSPLPYPEPDRLVWISDTNSSAGVETTGVASGNIADWRRGASGFAGIAGFYAMGRTLATDAGAVPLITAQVSQDFFPVMRVAPLLGRTFTPDDTLRGQFNSAAAPVGPDPVVILSHATWQQYFGADPDVIGRVVALERQPFEVVGVMPAGFAAPDPDVRLWIPWDLSGDRPRDQHYLGAVGRLRSGVTVDEGNAQLNAVARQLGEAFPETNRGWGVRVVDLHEYTVGSSASTLWILLAAVGVLLLVACANVALLSVIRGLDRAAETDVRLALGATSGRLVRGFLIESALPALGGGALGIALAFGTVPLLPRLGIELPRIDEVAIDGPVLAFTCGITMLIALMAGLPQAWSRSRATRAGGALTGSPRVAGDASRHRLRDLMVVAQVTLAVVLLVGASLLVRSYSGLRTADSGFDPRGVLVAPIFLDTEAYPTGGQVRDYYRGLFERLAALPGVTAVGGATTVPTSPLGPDFARPVWPEGQTDPAAQIPASVRMVTAGYTDAVGLRIVDGRAIDDRDQPDSPRVLMVNETLARRLWPGEAAVGQRLVVDYSTAGTYPYEVVGVVGDVRFRGPRSEPGPEVYFPHAQRSYLILNVVVRATGDPRALIGPVRAVLAEVDPQKPAQGLYPLESLLGATYARDRAVMTTLLAFSGTAVFLAVLSVYGVLAQRVRERAREIGIRRALGAGAPRLVRWLAGSGAGLMLTGLLLGLGTAWLLGGLLDGLLYGISASDPASALFVVLALCAAGALAVVVPAWRALRIDPVRVLRQG